MKVLFCTDGSEISRFAIEKAMSIIKKDFEIDIVTVMETGFLTTFVTYPHEVEVGFPEYKNAAEKLLNDTASLVESKGFKVGEKIQLNGDPADSIVKLISEKIYDFVILGSHGKKGIKRWLGSVSRKIAYKSPIPIFIAKPVKNLQKADENKNEILIAVDGTQNSYNAVRKACEILNLDNANIEILSVKSSLDDLPVEIRTDEEWLNKCIKMQNEMMDEIFENTTKILDEYKIKPANRVLLEGNAGEEILKYTEINHKDIITMGSHGREGLASLLIGSVSKIILDNVNTSVLIIQNKPESAK